MMHNEIQYKEAPPSAEDYFNLFETTGWNEKYRFSKDELDQAIHKSWYLISAHWLTRGTYVTASEKSRQIYDFYGFPPELYKIFYTPPGARDIARMIAKLVPGVEEDDAWGLDHASWAVLCHMYPGDRQREYCS